MKHLITPELLHKYLDGRCSPEEAFMLYRWYDAFEQQPDPLDELSPLEQEALKMLMFNNFKNSISATSVIDAPAVKKNGITVKVLYAVAGIAAMLLLVFAGERVFNTRPASTPNDIVTTTGEQMEVNNLTSSIYKQQLSDGSLVWLNPKSKLRYPKKFTGAYRQVKLTGQAFFEVTKDHAHPFIVYGGGVVTRVWGTSFRVRAYDNRSTEVSVVTGKVSVKLPDNAQSEVMLLPKQNVTLKLNGHTLKTGTESAQSAMRIWQKTNLNFDNTKLSTVLNALDKQYGMHVRTDDKELADYSYTGDFTGQNLPAILDMMENSLNVSYTMDDTDVILYRNKPSTN